MPSSALSARPSGPAHAAAAAVSLNEKLPRRAKTRKGKRALQEREAQEHEAVKRVLIIRGSRASASVQEMLSDMRDMKKPDVVYLHSVRRRGEGAQKQQQAFHPFEDISSGEFLCEKNNCGFFCLGSTSKKRPARLVFARMFAHQLLDMYELQVSRYTPAAAFRGKEKPHVGSTPIVLLQGAHFEANEALKGLRNLLADLFKGSAQADASGAAAAAAKQQRLYLAGIDRIIAISAMEPTVDDVRGMTAGAAETGAAAALQAVVHGAAVVDAAADSAEEEEKEEKTAAQDEDEDEASAVESGSKLKEMQQPGAEGRSQIYLRQYRVVMKKGAPRCGVPRVELEEVGPRLDMMYRLADAPRWKKATACRAAAVVAQKKKREAEAVAAAAKNANTRRCAATSASSLLQKNKKKRKTTTTLLGDVVGNVYVDKPDWRSLYAQKNVLLIKHNRKRARLAAEAAASATPAAIKGIAVTKDAYA